MNTYILTFGIGSELKRNYQPIIAENYDQARNEMINSYGEDWAFSYTEEEFEQSKQRGFFLNITPLKVLQAKEEAQ